MYIYVYENDFSRSERMRNDEIQTREKTRVDRKLHENFNIMYQKVDIIN